jgi:hypothetical protein
MFPLKEFKFWQGRARTAESYLHLSTGGYVCSVVLVMTEGNGNQLAKTAIYWPRRLILRRVWEGVSPNTVL